MSVSSSVEQLTGLKRKLTIIISADKVAEVYGNHLNKLMKTAKLPGFRPGKIPQKVIESRFSNNLRSDVMRELIDGHLPKAMMENKLQPVSQPELDIADIDQWQPKEAFHFSAVFEVYPDITLADFSTVTMERQLPEVADTDIDEVVQKIRRQHASKSAVERAAAKGDYLKIDFEGTCDGEPFHGNTATDFELELGGGRMIDGFEDGLIGALAGEVRQLSCRFPDDYHENLAGKQGEFKVTVKEVLEATLPELDDSFAAKVGVNEGIAAMRDKIKENLMQSAQQMVQSKLRLQVADKLFELHEIELPEVLLEQELAHMKKHDKSQDDPQQEARKRITLGLLLREVVSQHELKTDAQQVRAYLEQMAMHHPYPEQVMRWYYEDKKRLQDIEAIVMEHQAFDKVLSLMKVQEKPVAYSELLQG